MAKSKEPIWTPPEDVVLELLDAAAEKLPSDAIYPADIVKPAAEPLRDVLNGHLAGLGDLAGETPDKIFACLKAALIQADGELEMRKKIRQSYEREENRAAERLDILKTVAREMLDAYGGGSEETLARIHTPIGDLRYQKNSAGSVWVDPDRIDEIPEELGEFRLVKVTRTPLKEGIGQYLEDLPKDKRPDWAKLLPPGQHLKFS